MGICRIIVVGYSHMDFPYYNFGIISCVVFVTGSLQHMFSSISSFQLQLCCNVYCKQQCVCWAVGIIQLHDQTNMECFLPKIFMHSLLLSLSPSSLHICFLHTVSTHTHAQTPTQFDKVKSSFFFSLSIFHYVSAPLLSLFSLLERRSIS